jgi:titin
MTPTEQAEVVNFAIPTSAVADSYSTQHDTTLNQAAPGVLGNDPGSSALTAQLMSGPSHAASFTLNPDGSFSYKPAAGYAGPDSFTYVSQGEGGGHSAATTVTLTVIGIHPAITSGSSAGFRVGDNGSFTIRSTGVPPPSITESGRLPRGLTFTDNGDGTASIHGKPAPGSHGTYHVTITAANGQGSPATQQLALFVAPGPRPKAVRHTYRTHTGKRLRVRAPGLLRKDRGEGRLHVVLVRGSVRHGKLSLKRNGAFTFTPAAGFTGKARFKYRVVDADGQKSAPAMVTIVVRPA